MAQIKTVTTTSGENTVTFNAFYPYIWIRNTGDNDIIAANYSGASAGDVDTVSIKAGEVAMIQAETASVYIIGATTVELHAQGFAECPFKRSGKGGESITVTPLSVTQNGTYTAPTGTAYSPVTVDVQEQPWQPLQDGYSNFWFELTDDTLSPWLNFSAKTNDAVIDWGDGSGEVALDTLTPTHTYSKPGKYIVKVKGVTRISMLFPADMPASNSNYMQTLKYVELSTEVNTLYQAAFRYCVGLVEVAGLSNVTTLESYIFAYTSCLKSATFGQSISAIPLGAFMQCTSLKTITMPNITSISSSAFYYCRSIEKITLPQTVTSIGTNAFSGAAYLSEIHVQATTPPALSTNVFANIATDFIIYVPQGTGETYKAASGWSAYADHILEEGQTVTRAMQKKFAKEAKAIEDTGDMR